MAEETILAAATTTAPPAEGGGTPAASNDKPADKPAEGSEAGAKPAEGEGASKKPEDGKTDKGKEGAPEKYEFKFPEGVQADEALLGEFTPLAKDLGLSQEGAQKLVDLYTKTQTQMLQAQQERWEGLNKEWSDKSTADKEYGGADLNKNVAIAKLAIDKFGTPELKEALNLTGVGNHPEVVRFFYRVGKAISDDKFDTGNGKAGVTKDPAKLLFPNQN